jgi:hypothetical protein
MRLWGKARELQLDLIGTVGRKFSYFVSRTRDFAPERSGCSKPVPTRSVIEGAMAVSNLDWLWLFLPKQKPTHEIVNLWTKYI